MSSRSTRKSAAAVLDPADDTTTEAVATVEAQAAPESEALTIEAELAVADDDGSSGEGAATDRESESSTASTDGASGDSDNGAEETADILARQLEQLVSSVAVVEDLSRRARDVATTDLGLYD